MLKIQLWKGEIRNNDFLFGMQLVFIVTRECLRARLRKS